MHDRPPSELPSSVTNRGHREEAPSSEPVDAVPLAPTENPEGSALLSARDARLRDALQPILQSSILNYFESGSQRIVDSLYPLIGRAVRRSVRESLQALAQSVDTTMRDALTLRRWRWRLEAKRRGIPLAQLILEKSLLFRVEEVFLIHSETGLLIAHAGARADDSRDLVSGMFTAIQDFVADSFGGGAGKASDPLGRFQAGDQDVWLLHGPHAYMAVVISGNAPSTYREDFHRVLEEIHERFGRELSAFEGDPEPLERVGLLLDDCLLERKKDVPTRSPWLFWVIAGVLGLILLGFFARMLWMRHEHGTVRSRLQEIPGVVIVEESHGWNHSTFQVLADPGSGNVRAALALGESPSRVEIKPYYSLEPEVMANRLRLALAQRDADPQDALTVSVQSDGLQVAGKARHRSLEEVKALATSLNLSQVDFSKVTNVDQQVHVAESVALAKQVVRFLPNQARVIVGDGEQWRVLAEGMRTLAANSQEAGMACSYRLMLTRPAEVTAGAWALAAERFRVAEAALMSQGRGDAEVRPGGWLPPSLRARLEFPDDLTDALVVIPSFLGSQNAP